MKTGFSSNEEHVTVSLSGFITPSPSPTPVPTPSPTPHPQSHADPYAYAQPHTHANAQAFYAHLHQPGYVGYIPELLDTAHGHHR